MKAKSNVWSTKRVENLLKYWEETGSLPKDNPFFDKNPSWRKAGIVFEYTQKEYLEMAKIKENILYYGENYAKVPNKNGESLVKLRPYQIKVLLQFKKFHYNVYLASRQIGKSLSIFSLINIKDDKDEKIYVMPFFELLAIYGCYSSFIGKILLKLYRIKFRMLYKDKEYFSIPQL
jgi:hypothetical protein